MKDTAMRTLLLVAALAAPAAAEPALDQPCDVTIARASDDVRAQIADALIGEHCHTPLEVRAVAVDAGMIVAAWAAEAGAVNWAPELDHFAPTVVPTNGPTPALAPPSGAPLADAAATPTTRPHHKQLAIFGLVGDVSRGIRVAMDFGARGSWTFGASAAASTHRLMSYAKPWYMSADLDLVDTRAVGTVAHTWGTDAWRVRASIGFGVVYTRATTSPADHYPAITGPGINPAWASRLYEVIEGRADR